MSAWDPDATSLLGLLPQTGRGPRREGIFALWLTVRVAQDLLRDPPSERAHRRRRPFPAACLAGAWGCRLRSAAPWPPR